MSKSKKKVIYVAGPYRARTRWEIEKNIRRAEEFGFRLAEEFGVVPLIPHTMYRNFDGELTDEFWLDATLELLERCDAIYMCIGWDTSFGSIDEHKRAQELNIPIFDFESLIRGDLRQWVNESSVDLR